MKNWFATTKTQPIHFDERNEHPGTSVGYARHDLAKFFLAVLNLTKPVRAMFVKDFNRLLTRLAQQDFFGTEGQCDPRGDHRDLDF